jgi:tRNA-Thr(GGU) m(6)t(6)A37 methyltransferase TsaA
MNLPPDLPKVAIQAIGYIETPFIERFGTPRQPGLAPSSWGKITLDPKLSLTGAFEGLDGFSHVWLLFQFHENVNKRVHAKVHPPRMGGDKIGLFASRTPHRPNPIGLSVVKLEKVERETLFVSAVDLINGTPILDIKPYLPSADCLTHATSGWTDSRPERTINVEVSAEARRDFVQNLGAESDRYLRLACELLELDPRPVFYRGTADAPNPYTDTYGFRLGDFNIVYRMTDQTAQMVRLEPWQARENARDE